MTNDTLSNTRFILTPVGEQKRYGVTDRESGHLVPFKSAGRWHRWSTMERAIEGANTLNGREVYSL